MDRWVARPRRSSKARRNDLNSLPSHMPRRSESAMFPKGRREASLSFALEEPGYRVHRQAQIDAWVDATVDADDRDAGGHCLAGQRVDLGQKGIRPESDAESRCSLPGVVD